MEDAIAEITLADRLEAHTEQMANTSWGLTMQEWNVISNDILLAARTLRALDEAQARVERAEEALRPFADEADKWANCIDNDAQEILIAHPIDVTVDSYGEIDGLNDAAFTLGDLRRARAALNQEPGQ